ncbi:MAG: hypothetical protein MUO38_14625 [Anaerolineales bacterium]|nr:hypothetical protein [Anaerolineales bacterium]
MPSLTEAASAIQAFQKDDLGAQIGAIEAVLKGADLAKIRAAFPGLGIDDFLLDAALALKETTGQVNVIIHAIGILLAVPKILTPGEQVLDLSLGAGSTGKQFDLETTRRVAEFKFIHWKGGAESIRQNSLFKDFYLLAEYETDKTKELYVIGTKHPLKFLRGARALSSVMSRNNRLWEGFQEKYQRRFGTVSDYYLFRKDEVLILDLIELLPSLSHVQLADDQEEPA